MGIFLFCLLLDAAYCRQDSQHVASLFPQTPRSTGHEELGLLQLADGGSLREPHSGV